MGAIVQATSTVLEAVTAATKTGGQDATAGVAARFFSNLRAIPTWTMNNKVKAGVVIGAALLAIGISYYLFFKGDKIEKKEPTTSDADADAAAAAAAAAGDADSAAE